MQSDPLTNTTRPRTDATITVRVIKSFEYRNLKNLVLHHLDLEKMHPDELLRLCRQQISSTPGWKAFQTVELDTFKLYTKAHGAKTTNLVINLDHDEWILEDQCKTLSDYGLEHESEISLFNRADYEQFKARPQQKWWPSFWIPSLICGFLTCADLRDIVIFNLLSVRWAHDCWMRST